MKDRLSVFGKRATRILFVVAVCGLSWACKDEYRLDDEKPTWLQTNIYEMLQKGGNFKNYINLLNDSAVNPKNARPLTEVLSRTGSKTLFVADDKAWENFFEENKKLPKSNPWSNATCYENLTEAQKKLLVHSSMLNNAIVMENLASSDGSGSNPPVRGEYMRRYTDVVLTDTIAHMLPEQVPFTYNEKEMNYWRRFRAENGGKGLYLVKDSTLSMMLHFTDEHMSKKSITNEDFNRFMGHPREVGEVYINDALLLKKDSVAENGYVNVTSRVIKPLPNMAEALRTCDSTQIFSHMLDRFSFPYYNYAVTEAFLTLHPDFKATHPDFNDSIYTLKYFAQIGPGHKPVLYGPDGERFQDENGEIALKYDPGWNEYYDESAVRADMACMYVPTDRTLLNYFSRGGEGWSLVQTYAKEPEAAVTTLDDLYKKIDDIPLSTLQSLINVIMFRSFVGSVPSKMTTLRDDAQDEIFQTTDKQNIIGSMLASNGVVYLTDKVYGPADYTSVAAPAYISKTNLLMKWAIYNGNIESQDQMKLNYYAYLKAMKSKFLFFLPSDEALKRYYDPVSFTSQKPRMLEMNYTGKGVFPLTTKLYRYDPQTAKASAAYNNEKIANDEVVNRLKDILESHTIVLEGSVENVIDESKNEYYVTKNGSAVKLERDENGTIVGVKGGFQIENERAGRIDGDKGTTVIKVTSSNTHNKKNGRTYVLDDAPIIPASRSVYGNLSEFSADPDGLYAKFFAMTVPNTNIIEACGLVDSKLKADARTRALKKYQPFIDDKGVDYNVQFFNNYRYTVLVPTNTAIEEAEQQGLPTWETIEDYYNSITNNGEEQIPTWEDSLKLQAMIVYLNNFVRVHFLDNSVFVDKDALAETDLVSSSYNSNLGVFMKVHAKREMRGGKMSMIVRDDVGGNEILVTDNCNVLARDISCSTSPVGRNTMNGITIQGSSFAVIHEIDGVMRHTELVNGRYDSDWATPAAAKAFIKKFNTYPEKPRYNQ